MSEKSIHTRLYDMLVKLKASEGHPVWFATSENMGFYISRRLGLETATGQPVDEAYVARLESHMPRPRVNPDTKFTIAISMRGERDVKLNKSNHLLFHMGNRRLSLGAMNSHDIDNLCEYLQRLKIHLPA